MLLQMVHNNQNLNKYMINNFKATGHSIDHDKTRNLIVTTFLLIIMTVKNM